MDKQINLLTKLGRRTAAIFALALAMFQSLPAAAYVPDDRWSITASGATGGTGTPVTLTWSIAPDGTNIPGEGASNLVSYLDGLFGVTSGGSNLTTRPWFTYFQQSVDRWTQLGGITFVYESHDDGTSLQTTSGALGTRGDVRIGGAFVDGPSNTLAYTWLPNSGDMVIDTGETNFYSNSSNAYRQLRNTVMHELGHAFGLLHIESSTENLLMEPIINLSFDGPQLDDIRGLQGQYGDAFEKTNNGLGNGTAARATSLGALAIGGSLDVGSDAVGNQFVGATETDFVSIANANDADFFSFTIAAPASLDATLTPLGGVFNQGVEGGVQSSFDANSRNDLTLSVFASNGTTLLGTANLTSAGSVESLTDIALATAGKYYARITGASENVQLYQLLLSAASLVTVLPGDYNLDGTVDAADFTVWRNMLGRTGSNLAADGNGDGVVNASDYDLWKTHFGTSGAGSGGIAVAGSVPEPSGVVLACVAAACAFQLRNRPAPRRA
ncbi:MAG: matrixin family metalloprotease [Pirellulales bacterium]